MRISDAARWKRVIFYAMRCVFFVLPEAGKVIWSYLQFYLRDDRVVMNNGG